MSLINATNSTGASCDGGCIGGIVTLSVLFALFATVLISAAVSHILTSMEEKKKKEEAADHEPIDIGDEDVGQHAREHLEGMFARANEAQPKYTHLGGLAGIAKILGTDLDKGIDSTTLDARCFHYGKNELPAEEPLTFLDILIGAWQDHMIIILSLAAIVSLILGFTTAHPGEDHVDFNKGWIEGTAILISVFIVTTVSSVNDYRKEQKFRKLTEDNAAQDITVMRDGAHKIVDVTELVVGDLVGIDAGLVTPVDGFYVKGQSVVVDESAVTGENDPKKKNAGAPFFLTGTVVNTAENGWVLVGGVGENSFGGKLLMEARGEGGIKDTPLQERLDEMAAQIGYFGFAAAILLFIVLSTIEIVKFAKHDPDADGKKFLSHFIIGVAIVVVAVPEGLPLAVTISLAYSQNKMRKDNNQVRRLKACETMGNATQICSDKTGTLTQNLMSVVQMFVAGEYFQVEKPGEFLEKITISGIPPEIQELIFHTIALNSSSQKEVVSKLRDGTACAPKWQWEVAKGNKTDNALLDLVDRCLLTDDDATALKSLPHQRIRSSIHEDDMIIFPFTSDRKRMSCCVRQDGKIIQYIKGGADQLFADCKSYMTKDGKTEKLTQAVMDDINARTKEFASNANRNIGLAFAKLSDMTLPEEEPEVEMTWVGVIGIQDPLRPEVKEAVNKCQHAGVTVRMCTGDNIDTAIAISKGCNIYNEATDLAMEGKEFRQRVYDAFSAGKDEEEAFFEMLGKLTVLARSQPLDKQLLVLMLMTQGEVVAVTGDGTNDAPALKLANVGFVMRSGTDIAVKSADIVLLDDNFRSVQRAVVWGRTVNDNIRKFLQLQLTVNVASVLLTFIGSVSSDTQTSPLSTVQLLWINLIMDTFAALALATEEPNESCLDRGPINKKAPLITRRMACTILVQSVLHLTISLLLQHLGHKWFDVSERYEKGKFVTKDNTEHTTIIFNTFVWLVIFNEFNARKLYEEKNLFEGFHRSKAFFFILAITIAFQVFAVEVARDFMRTVPLTWKQWLICLAFGVLSWPFGVLSRFIPITEPVYAREFDEEELDDDAKKMMNKLKDDIKDKVGGHDIVGDSKLVHSASYHNMSATHEPEPPA